MRTYLAAMVLAVLIAPAFAEGQEGPIPFDDGCHEDDRIQIIGQKFAEDPPSYSFRVVNGSDFAVWSVNLGRRGFDFEIYFPESLGGPEGWEIRRAGYGHESPDMHYLWTVNRRPDGLYSESPNVIPPGESLSGFSVQLSTWEQPIFRQGVDSEPVFQDDLRTISFTVLTTGGCISGRVQPDGLQARQEPD